MTPEELIAALEDCRDRVDHIDRRLVMLLNERARVVEQIGDLKQEQSMKVYEPKREELVIANVTESSAGPLQAEALKRIYERIMDEMRTLQRERMAAKRVEGDPKC
jgi:chorismate mutase-like protein